MYYHCNLAFPLVEINFEKEEDFNPEKMIDFINRGKNRKVNFVILPSLFSFGSFLQNGKAWVFTFYKNTFRFDDLQLNHSLNVEDFFQPINSNELKEPNFEKNQVMNGATKISASLRLITSSPHICLSLRTT